jgi:hypothetical protein
MAAAAVLLAIALVLPAGPQQRSHEAGKTAELLRRIFDEVRTFGPEPSPSAQPVQQDFFIGGPDDDDTNKDVHVAVLIYRLEGFEMMKIRVTTLERSRENPRVKFAAGSKACACRIDPEGIVLVSSDFAEKELARTAAELLKAIADKKRLIKG